ncbi:MAG: hypothetical protein WCH11_01080, partial [Bdellovibrio sp.]
LSKPVRSTGFESPLRFRRLSFVYAEHEDIFESLLWSAFRACRREEFLLYAHAEKDIKLRPPPAWVSARIPHALYVVVPPSASPPDFLNPQDNLLPEVESVLI